jgi:transcriptional regulator with XRE-family HTH domain
MDAPGVGRIGGYIKEQRETAKLSLRRLAQEAGVSNPYLSQVERGLRKPSAEILQQLAKALRISAEQLYVQAGLLEDKGASLAVESAVLSDAAINERQKRVLLDIYSSFLTENAFSSEAAPTVTAPPKRSRSAAATSPKKRAASKPSVKQQHASSPAAPTVKSRSVRRNTRRAASSTNTTR